MNIKFLGNTIVLGKIELMTGMHIGGNKDTMEIGGIDSPVIRDPETSYPYIPGSSMKGKLRMLTEFAEGKLGNNASKGYVCDCGDIECAVCRIFGTAADPGKGKGITGPTRIIVRDSFPDEKTVSMWEGLNEDYLFTEGKSENGLNRLTSEANPRIIERVVKGSAFDFHMVIGKYEVNGRKDSDDDVKIVLRSMKILEDAGLGGSVSRGYGRIRFRVSSPVFVSADDYYNGKNTYIDTRYDRIATINNESLKRLAEMGA